jgi:hypothetical protein
MHPVSTSGWLAYLKKLESGVKTPGSAEPVPLFRMRMRGTAGRRVQPNTETRSLIGPLRILLRAVLSKRVSDSLQPNLSAAELSDRHSGRPGLLPYLPTFPFPLRRFNGVFLRVRISARSASRWGTQQLALPAHRRPNRFADHKGKLGPIACLPGQQNSFPGLQPVKLRHN